MWSRRRAVTLCSVIYIGMTCLALPSALRYRTIRCVQRDTQQWRLEVELTEMWQNKTFVLIYTWIQNLMRSIIPLIVLIILNACIVWALRKTRTKRRKSSRHRVTVMMIVVILTFLICITPDAILSTVFGFGYHEAGYLVKGIREITDTLLGVNAGVNFLIYCAFNKVFRRRCARLCCSRVPPSAWITEMDESIYRRLSEAKSALFSNNNSPPRQGKKALCSTEQESPSRPTTFSPTKTPRQRRSGHQLFPSQERSEWERGVCFYLPSNQEEESPQADTPCYSEDEENESKSLIHGHDASCKSYSVPAESVPASDFLTVGQLISASLSMPSLPQLLQDIKSDHPLNSKFEMSPNYKRNSNLENHHKSISQPHLPVPNNKYEIPACSCFSQANIQRKVSSSLLQIPFTSFLQGKDPSEATTPPNTSLTTDQQHPTDTPQRKDMKTSSRSRHRPSSNGLKKSKNSVKSRRAKRRGSYIASVCSDSECGRSENSFGTDSHDEPSKESCFRNSTDGIPRDKLYSAHLGTDKKLKRSRFVPPCFEGVRDKDMDIRGGYKDSGSRVPADDTLTCLKQCDGSSLKSAGLNRNNREVSSVTNHGSNGGDPLHHVTRTILNTSKRKSCPGSLSKDTTKRGRGPVVRFQDTCT